MAEKRRVLTPEHRRKISEAMKGRRLSLEHKRNLSETAKGRVNSPEARRKMSEAKKGKLPWISGKCHSPEARRKMSEAAKRRGFSPETIRKMSEANRGKHLSLEIKHKISKAHKRNWQDLGYAQKILAAHQVEPTEPERRFDTILQSLFPGDFSLNVCAEVMVLGGKVPDFVNVNGKKQVIELYGNYWHRHDNPQERIDYFRQFGWDTLIIWERELEDEDKLQQKLMAFIKPGKED